MSGRVVLGAAAGDEAVGFKVVLVGPSTVGKTSFANRVKFMRHVPATERTIGVDYFSKLVDVAGTRVRLEVWDTAGQEEFASLSKFFLRNASGAFLLFDVTSRASFDQLQRVWVPRIKEEADATVCLLTNKVDLEAQEVEQSEADALGAELDAATFRTSSVTAEGIDDALQRMAADLLRRYEDKDPGVVPLDAAGAPLNSKSGSSVRLQSPKHGSKKEGKGCAC